MLSLVRTTPGASLFPEIDFASKISREANQLSYSLQNVLSTLSMANTFEIRRALANSKFHVYMNLPSPEIGRDKPITVIDCKIEDDGRAWDRISEGESEITR